MKKTLMILGGVFVVIVVLTVAGIAIVAVEGKGLDKESRQYVDATVPDILSEWNITEIQNRASPEFKAAVKGEDLEKMVRMFRRLGKFKAYNGAKGQARISVTAGQGKVISAAYVVSADFDTGPAEIGMSLIKGQVTVNGEQFGSWFCVPRGEAAVEFTGGCGPGGPTAPSLPSISSQFHFYSLCTALPIINPPEGGAPPLLASPALWRPSSRSAVPRLLSLECSPFTVTWPIKHGDQWQLLGISVNSKVLLEQHDPPNPEDRVPR